MCVYNDEGDELALKLFEADEEHETMELGTLREGKILFFTKSVLKTTESVLTKFLT